MSFRWSKRAKGNKEIKKMSKSIVGKVEVRDSDEAVGKRDVINGE